MSYLSLRFCPLPATSKAASLPAQAAGRGEGIPSLDALMLLSASRCYSVMLRIHGPDHRQTALWRGRAVDAASFLIGSGMAHG